MHFTFILKSRVAARWDSWVAAASQTRRNCLISQFISFHNETTAELSNDNMQKPSPNLILLDPSELQCHHYHSNAGIIHSIGWNKQFPQMSWLCVAYYPCEKCVCACVHACVIMVRLRDKMHQTRAFALVFSHIKRWNFQTRIIKPKVTGLCQNTKFS